MLTEDSWLELEKRAREAGPGLARRRLFSESGRNLFIGVAMPSGNRVLVLSIPQPLATEIPPLPSTRALVTTVEDSPDSRHSDIRVTLVATEMRQVFTPFVEDVLSAAAAASTDQGAVAAFRDRFVVWRHLLAGGSDGLGVSEQQGLYGELWILRRFLRTAWGDRAVAAWTGPDRADVDFQLGGVAVEVKTTVADNPATVAITSERQLSTASFACVCLAALSLEALPAGVGETLNEIVDALYEGLGPAGAVELRDRLLEYGYSEAHRRAYDYTRYTLRRLRCYEVGDGFPRITEEMLPDGIGQVRYLLALEACAPWALSEAQFEASLGKIACPD